MATGERRYGGLPLKGTRVHKVKKYNLIEEALDEEMELALVEFDKKLELENDHDFGRDRDSGMENST